MKQSSEIHSLGVCENGNVTVAFQNILREIQDLIPPVTTECHEKGKKTEKALKQKLF